MHVKIILIKDAVLIEAGHNGYTIAKQTMSIEDFNDVSEHLREKWTQHLKHAILNKYEVQRCNYDKALSLHTDSELHLWDAYQIIVSYIPNLSNIFFKGMYMFLKTMISQINTSQVCLYGCQMPVSIREALDYRFNVEVGLNPSILDKEPPSYKNRVIGWINEFKKYYEYVCEKV